MSEPSVASPAAKAGLFAELRRRRVLRTLALYVVGAWGLVQIADVVFPALGLAEASIRYLLFLAVAGFPVALVFAWLFDISSAGIHRTAPASAAELAERTPLRAADYLILASLLLVLGLIGYGVVKNADNIPLPGVGEGGSADLPDWKRGDGPPVIGVLPFDHLGSSEDGAFFATGVHDDLLTSLSKLSALRIISRTSMLQYADTAKPIPRIGRELGADAILEGGVRVAGDQIRINAQLIDARSDEHLWAETYDRELTADNIFAVQSEIARSISSALQTALTQKESEELDIVPTSNLAAYRVYHETMQWRETIHLDDTTRPQFVDGLERAFALDPSFTRPMVELVGVLALNMYRNADRPEMQRVEQLINRIGEIAPNSADYYTAQSFYFYYVLEDFERANALIEKAQERAPSDPRLITIQSWIQRRQGDFEGWLASAVKARKLDPRDAQLGRSLAVRLKVMHRYEPLREVLGSLDDNTFYLEVLRSQLDFAEHQDLGRLQASIEAILEGSASDNPDSLDAYFSLWEVQSARELYGQARETVKQMQSIITANGMDSGPPQQQLWMLVNQLILSVVPGDRTATEEMLGRISAVLTSLGQTLEEHISAADPMRGASLAVARGQPDAARQLLSGMWRDPELDRSVWLKRQQICQMLALAGAAKESTACLRNSLEEPSDAMHFYEPYLAYYDAVRDSAEFQQLVQELREEGWLQPQR